MNRKRIARSGGAWIKPNGDIIPVYDHFLYMRQHPKEFGLSAEEIGKAVKESPGKSGPREEFLKKVMRNGWIRVREHEGYKTYEFWGLSDDKLWSIRSHLKVVNAWDEETVMLSDLKKDDVYPTTVGHIMSEQGALQLVARKKGKNELD